MKTLHTLTHWCLDLVFPKYCLGCGQEGFYLCAGCAASLPTLTGANCFICGRRSPTGYACDNCRRAHCSLLSGILIASDWNNLLLRQIIYEYKYRFVKELAAPLSQLMIAFLERTNFVNMFGGSNINVLLIPVPLHGRRLAWRGFNQSKLLAQKVNDHFNLPLLNNILIRSRHTLPQREITDQKTRTANIQNAFALAENYSHLPSLRSPLERSEAIPRDVAQNLNPLKNKIIILIDDICTTGATFQDCARALAPLNPKEIWGLVIARG